MKSMPQNYDDLKSKESATPQSKQVILEMRKLFVGKKKFLTIPIVLLVGLLFLPITILLLIGWLIYAKIPNKKIRIAGLSVIGLFILFFGWAYVSAIFNPTPPKPATKIEREIVETKTSPSPSPTPTPTPTPQTKGLQTKIITVIDGDTIEVSIDNKKEAVRLIGINSPETVDPRKPVECFAKEASDKAKQILTDKTVSLESDSTQGDRDKYNRLLRYVWLEDYTNFNKLMISEGYAYEYTYNTPYKYQTEFKKAENDARDNKKGLWADNTCAGKTAIPVATSQSTQPTQGSSGGFTCSGKKTCGQMTSCAEAKFYLNSCGVKSLDRNGDGIPCETICK